jgi:hypothetical protein
MVDEKSELKKVFLKSLYGNDIILRTFIDNFKAEFKDKFKQAKTKPSGYLRGHCSDKKSGHILVGTENELTL